MRLSEKGIQTLDRQAKAIDHYEAALMALSPVQGDALNHWNEARKVLTTVSTEVSDYVNYEM